MLDPQHIDPVALALTILLVVGWLLITPLERWLNQQRAKRRRNQAIAKRKAGRWS